MTPGPSPLSDPAGFWNGCYAEPGYAYGEQPNDVLRERATALPPGDDVLCLAEGEGRNAVIWRSWATACSRRISALWGWPKPRRWRRAAA